MSPDSNAVTVGVDVGTTSVKAVAVDEKGQVVARSRVPHSVVAPEPDLLRHDAKKAWWNGPRKAFQQVTEELGDRSVAGVTVASMVPSLTAVNRNGVPVLPGLLYGDREGRVEAAAKDGLLPGSMPDAEGFLGWAHTEAPDARGYWPCQAVATNALSGLPAVDTAVTASLGSLHMTGRWNADLLASVGVDEAQLPMVVPMGVPAGTLPGSDTIVTGGTIDALCDQIVAGASETGDVLVIFGATLIAWAVTDQWLTVPGLVSFPHTTPDRFLIGGPSNAGALFVDWARQLLRGAPKPGPDREKLAPRLAIPGASRCGCPTSEESAHRSRTTPSVPTSTGSTSARAQRRSSGRRSRPAVSSCNACSRWQTSRGRGSWPAGADRG
jgi:xylulokinase